MDKQAIKENLVRFLQDIQHALDLIRRDGRLISEDHAEWTVESLNLLSANFTKSIKWITTASQNLQPKQVRDQKIL